MSLQSDFDYVMAHLAEGVPSEMGFSSDVTNALAALSINPEDDGLRRLAREALARQLDGDDPMAKAIQEAINAKSDSRT